MPREIRLEDVAAAPAAEVLLAQDTGPRRAGVQMFTIVDRRRAIEPYGARVTELDRYRSLRYQWYRLTWTTTT